MIKAYRHTGEPIKAIEGNRVSGYLVRFTSKEDPDLHGEYFTKDTNFWLKELSPIGKPIFLDHAFDGKFKSIPVGIIDFLREDEIGIWIEGKLKERAEYEDMLRGWKDRKWLPDSQLADDEIPLLASNLEKAVKSFFMTGKAQWSSGALPQSVEVAEDNHIESWAIIEGTGVHTPAEPDGTEIKLKSALNHMSELLNSLPPATQDAAIDAQHKEPTTENAVSNKSNSITPNKGTSKMTIQELVAGMQALLAEFGESGGVPPEEAMAMADEVVDELKAEAEALPEEEQAKAVDEEMVKAWTGKAVAKLDTIRAKNVNLLNVAKNAMNDHKRNQPATEANALGGFSAGNRGASNISVSDNLKYAHLSALDMAMVWKMSVAASGLGVRGFQGKRATDFVSEEFYKTAVHKMMDYNGSRRLSRGHEELEVKSMMPFKANELNASDITGQGLEWLGYSYDSQVWESARNNMVYKAMMERGMLEKPVAQGMKGSYVPLESDDLTVYGGSEGNSVDATGRPEVVYKIQPQTTSTVLVEPGTFRTATAYTFELQEDSFVDMAAEANRKIRIALEENIEKAFINADSDATASTNINLIDGSPTASGLQKDYYLEFDGLRKSPLVTSTSYSRSGTTLAVDDYRQTWALLGSTQAPRKENIFFLIDFSTFQATLDLLPVLTKDVAGEQNSLFTGELNELWGIPVLMSGFLGLSNTAGKISATPGNNTKGQILAVYAPYWAFVFKRNITIEMQRNPASESFEFYGSMRFALKRRSASASAISYNITV